MRRKGAEKNELRPFADACGPPPSNALHRFLCARNLGATPLAARVRKVRAAFHIEAETRSRSPRNTLLINAKVHDK